MPANEMTPLSEEEVRTFVKDWYDVLDVHAPVERLLPLMTDDVEMRFPEVTTYGKDAFGIWYDRILHTFFDEVHILKSVEVAPDGQEGLVEVLVNWEASVWRAPVAASDRIHFDAGQTWTLRRSPDTGKAAIAVYNVHTFTPVEGSANLPVLPRELAGSFGAAVNAGDWDGWVALLADDVVVDDPVAGHLEGKDQVAAGGDDVRTAFANLSSEPLHIVSDGEQVVVVWMSAATTGITYLQVADGKVSRLRTVYDPAAAGQG